MIQRSTLGTLVLAGLLLLATSAGQAGEEWQQRLARAEREYAAQAQDVEVRTELAAARFRAGQLHRVDELWPEITLEADASAAPARAWLTLGRLRAAEGRHDEAASFLDRAVTLAPEDPEVLYWAGDLARRGRAIELLERFLAHAEGQDPDRIEAAEGTIRVLRELGDRAVWQPENSPPSLEAPLEQVWTSSGAIVGYTLKIGLGQRKKPVRLLLDTGSHGLFLSERQARKRGFAPLAQRVLHGGGGSGRHTTVRGVFPSFRIGELAYRDALGTVAAGEFDPTGRFHGLLGVSVLGGYRVVLDLRGKRLQLTSGQGALDGAPYWWVSGQLLVRACVSGGREDAVCGLFIVDTGAMSSVLHRGFAESVPGARLGSASAVQGFGGRVGDARIVEGVEIDFQELERRPAPVISYDLSVSSRLGGVEVSGLLGLDLLAGHVLVLDTPTQTVRVERPGRSR